MAAPFALGRRVNHDPRSRAFPAPAAATLRSVSWRRWSPVLEQGDLGSCTGNAIVGALGTQGLYKAGTAKALTEELAVSIYKRATVIDPFPGSWPPDDTGSDGLSVCKVAKELGLIASYSHAFGLDHCLAALALSPVMVGVPWLESMFSPGSSGLVDVWGAEVGGHEFVLTGLDVRHRLVRARNSWGMSWGVGGFFYLRWEDLGSLLERQGDCSVPKREA
jgi:hypothetical protein